MKLHNFKEDMKLLIRKISERTCIREDILEKDYYVTLMLKELTNKENQNYAFFKGGTALYKALKSVRRFSEDIDLTVYIDDVASQNQAQKRLKKVVYDFKSLKFNEKISDKRGSIEVSYSYKSLFNNITNDILQRFEIVKIEATNFTISEPTENIEISPHLYELATEEEKNILDNLFKVKPFKIKTIKLDRIFIDKIFAAENYYRKNKYFDLSKHIYDIVVMKKLPIIYNLLNNESLLMKILFIEREEEKRRYGGISNEIEVKDFCILNNISFFESSIFNNNLKVMQNIYVFDKEDFITIEDIKDTLNYIFSIFKNIKG